MKEEKTCNTPKATTSLPTWEEEFNELYGDTDVYENDLIPKNDVLATHHHIKKFISRTIANARREGMQNITSQDVSMLRQWLNEDKIDDPKKMVTNEDIMYWLKAQARSNC